MEKTITVNGEVILLKSHGAIPLLYKKQFNKDFFADVVKMGIGAKKFDLTKLDTEVFYNVTWLFAKTANKELPSTPIEWLETFESFPLMDVLTEIMDMVTGLLHSKKK